MFQYRVSEPSDTERALCRNRVLIRPRTLSFAHPPPTSYVQSLHEESLAAVLEPPSRSPGPSSTSVAVPSPSSSIPPTPPTVKSPAQANQVPGSIRRSGHHIKKTERLIVTVNKGRIIPVTLVSRLVYLCSHLSICSAKLI
jgi:hypothetical protein